MKSAKQLVFAFLSAVRPQDIKVREVTPEGKGVLQISREIRFPARSPKQREEEKLHRMKSANHEAVTGFTRAYRRIGGTLHAVDQKNGEVIQTSKSAANPSGVTWRGVFDRIT